jgi:hypothetical protein
MDFWKNVLDNKKIIEVVRKGIPRNSALGNGYLYCWAIVIAQILIRLPGYMNFPAKPENELFKQHLQNLIDTEFSNSTITNYVEFMEYYIRENNVSNDKSPVSQSEQSRGCECLISILDKIAVDSYLTNIVYAYSPSFQSFHNKFYDLYVGEKTEYILPTFFDIPSEKENKFVDWCGEVYRSRPNVNDDAHVIQYIKAHNSWIELEKKEDLVIKLNSEISTHVDKTHINELIRRRNKVEKEFDVGEEELHREYGTFGYKCRESKIVHIPNIKKIMEEKKEEKIYRTDDVTYVKELDLDEFIDMPDSKKMEYFFGDGKSRKFCCLPTAEYFYFRMGFLDYNPRNLLPPNTLINNGINEYYLHGVVLRVEGPHFCFVHIEWSSEGKINKYIYYNDINVYEITKANANKLIDSVGLLVMYFRKDLLGRTINTGSVPYTHYEITHSKPYCGTGMY